MELGVAERRIQLRNVHLLRRIGDPRHLVGALERLAERKRIRMIRHVPAAHAIAEVVRLGTMPQAGDPNVVQLVLPNETLGCQHHGAAAARLRAAIHQFYRPGNHPRRQHLLDGGFPA